MEVEVKQLRCEMIQLKLENKLMAEKISDLEETKEENEIEKLKMEIERFKTQNKNKEYRIKHLEYYCVEKSDSAQSSQGEYEEKDKMKTPMKYTNTEEVNKGEENEVNQNTEQYTRGELNDQELEEWFEVETVCGDDIYQCNFCDSQCDEYNTMKEHLISKHRHVVATLYPNSAKYLEKY